jgi:hypothetical protein
MHLAMVRNWVFLLSEEFRLAAFPARLAHARWAVLNAGDWVLMELGMISPPLAGGSGKSGTPCARMHCASLRSGPPPADGAGLEEPQEEMARAQTGVAHAAIRRR